MGRHTCREKKLYLSRGSAMIALVTIWRTNASAPQESLPRDFYKCVECKCFHLTSGKGALWLAAKNRADDLKQRP